MSKGTATGFTSASNLIGSQKSLNEKAPSQEASFANSNLGTPTKEQQPTFSSPAPERSTHFQQKKPRGAKVSNDLALEEPKEKARAATATSGVEEAPRLSIAENGKKRDKKSKDQGVEGQKKLKKLRVIKPHAADADAKFTKSTTRKKTSKKTLEQEKDDKNTKPRKLKSQDFGALDLCLDRAQSRRTDWTPPRDTNQGFALLEELELPRDREASLDNPIEEIRLPIQGLNHLLTDYGYAQSTVATAVVTKTGKNGAGEVTKRRKVEVCVEHFHQASFSQSLSSSRLSILLQEPNRRGLSRHPKSCRPLQIRLQLHF